MRSIRLIALRIIPPLLLLLVAAAVWEVYARSGALGQDVLPPLSRVATAGWDDRASLWENTLPTLREVLIGFAVSLVFAFVVSVAIDASGIARRSLMPVLIGSQTIPLIVLAPLVVIWFGFGLTPKILLVALVTFFPIVVGLVEGYASSDRDAITLLRTMGASWPTTFRLVRLPAALPGFFTGLRIAITYAVVAAIFAEYAGAEYGLGVYMQGAKASFRTDLVLAAVVVSALLTLVLFAATYVVQALVIPWYAESKRVPQ
jgi:ABC-type nitrate/sulfonate/bicarbonate transport system permease component